MNSCREFIMTCAELTASTKGSYVPVKKTLPVLYEKIGEEQVKLMLASFVVANYHGRMQKSVLLWAVSVIDSSSKKQLSYWPDMSPALLYDFAKAAITKI